MIGVSVLVLSLLIAAPPATSGLRIPTASPTTAIKTVSTAQPRTAPIPPFRATPRPAIRTAQVLPKPELPPQPQPLRAPPLPIETAPHVADPYETPRAAPQLPPPPMMDQHAPQAVPMLTPSGAMPPAPPQEPVFASQPGAAELVDNNGYAGACPNCYGCPCNDDDGCCLCGKIVHPCDMYPHYAYYPKYHGHYYFRPYNYTTVFQQQQWAATVGIDPRNPYSNKVFCVAMAGFAQTFRPENAPIGSALPVGNGLPQLEELLSPKTPVLP